MIFCKRWLKFIPIFLTFYPEAMLISEEKYVLGVFLPRKRSILVYLNNVTEQNVSMLALLSSGRATPPTESSFVSKMSSS